MRTVCLSFVLILVAAAAGGTALLAQADTLQKSGKAQQPPMIGHFVRLQAVQIPLRDSSGAERATLAYIPGAGGKGAVTITDRNGARIDLVAASNLDALPALDVGRIRLPRVADNLQSSHSEGNSNENFLRQEISKLDKRIKQLEAKLGK